MAKRSTETLQKPASRNVRHGRGVVDPNLLYTTDALMTECNLGRRNVTEMRQEGGVQPIQIGTQLYYDGADVKAWILSKKPKPPPVPTDYEEAKKRFDRF